MVYNNCKLISLQGASLSHESLTTAIIVKRFHWEKSAIELFLTKRNTSALQLNSHLRQRVEPCFNNPWKQFGFRYSFTSILIIPLPAAYFKLNRHCVGSNVRPLKLRVASGVGWSRARHSSIVLPLPSVPRW
ncbi:hypothetical protein RRG08_046285 [Elysia crispata]|uniref:Uncharacterized protein n=1 Tax=Elysia crispata TaxID=231223 RepID=A0AAE1D0S5_9GAST|nr:hypothetical protein RRG08_046285 [Elysia crispata]